MERYCCSDKLFSIGIAEDLERRVTGELPICGSSGVIFVTNDAGAAGSHCTLKGESVEHVSASLFLALHLTFVLSLGVVWIVRLAHVGIAS